MRTGVLLGLSLAALACGDRTELNTPRFSSGVTGAGASIANGGSGTGGDVVSNGGSRSSSSSGTPDGGGGEGGGRPIAPTPSCTGKSSTCIQQSDGIWVGAAIVSCEAVEFVGPWNLLLERSINNNFVTVQTKAVQEPGFGAIFDDTSGPPIEETYRVCVVDAYGTRCGAPFKTDGPVDCQCIPLTCEQSVACNITMDDGCGGIIRCDECTNGVPCNDATQSCCAPGFESDGEFGCVCAPPAPCPRGLAWDTSECSCEANI